MPASMSLVSIRGVSGAMMNSTLSVARRMQHADRKQDIIVYELLRASKRHAVVPSFLYSTLAHSLARSFKRSLVRSLTPSLIHSLTHSLTHPPPPLHSSPPPQKQLRCLLSDSVANHALTISFSTQRCESSICIKEKFLACKSIRFFFCGK